MAEAVRVVIEEMCGGKIRCWQYTDSASALAIVTGDSASWRTRHLRKRARFLRWKAMRGDVVMRHQPGSNMVADIGTKALASVRLKELKGMLGLIEEELDEASDFQAVHDGPGSCRSDRPKKMDSDQAGKLVKVLMVMALVQRATGAEEEEEGRQELEWAVLLYTMLVIAVTAVCQQTWSRWTRGVHQSSISQDRSTTNVEMEGEEAPLPALQRRASQAAQRTSTSSTTNSGGARSQLAGTIQPSTTEPVTSQPSTWIQRGCSSASQRSPEDTGSAQSTGSTTGQQSNSEDRQTTQVINTAPRDSRSSGGNQQAALTPQQADKHVSLKNPGETSPGKPSANPAGSSSRAATTAQPPTSTSRPKTSAKSHKASINSQPQPAGTRGQPKASSSSATSSGGQIPPNQPIPGRWVERENYEVYTTGSGACYHLNENCYGLRNSRLVSRVEKCPVCFGSNWKPTGETMHAQYSWGDIHRSVDHAREHYRLPVNQSCIVYTACKLCAKGA